MKIPGIIIIFTIWHIQGTMAADSCTPVHFVTTVTECSSNCRETQVATGCSCSSPPSAVIVNASTIACSINPLSFRRNNGRNTYDLILNNTIDLDLECMESKSLQYRFWCGPLTSTYPIEITPKNEFLPTFCDLTNQQISSAQSVSIYENLAEGGIVWQFKVCDRDKFDNPASVQFRPNGLFEITENNDMFTLKLRTNSTLDYDKNNTYLLELQILDGNFTNVTLDLTVNVKDVDNKPPAFDNETLIYYMHVNESLPSNTYVGKVHAADEDTINATILYQLETVDDLFWIDKGSGSLYTNGTFDREKVDSYTLVVKAYQENNPINRFTLATVEVSIDDVDDNPPVMSEKDYYATIQENAPNHSFVIQIQATDADKNKNNTEFCFKVVAHPKHVDPDPFFLNSTTGIISVSNQTALDFELWNETEITVRAVSTSHPSMMSNISVIHIQLTDTNDNSPQCGQLPNCTIYKNESASDRTICKVKATDADSKTTGNGIVSYSIRSYENDSVHFNISSATGDIKLIKNVSWPYVSMYRLDIVVEDHPQLKSEKRSTVCEVFIHVKDVNMFPPVISSPLNGCKLNITEGAAPPTRLVQVNVTDKDPDDLLNYTIVAGGNSSFIIDSSGVIRVIKTLDREQIPSYDITVVVTDLVKHTAQSTFHVEVLDVNDESPKFSNISYFFQVDEENVTVCHVMANDSDSGQNGKVEYELQNNPWTSKITINNTTGEIHVPSIDRENLTDGDQIQLLVIAMDHGIPKQSGFAMITITVKDINDHAPTFKEPTRSFDLKESFQGVFYHAQAIDLDAGENAVVHYKMIQGNESIFSVLDNGTVSVKQPLVLDGRNNDSITLEIEAYNTVKYTNPKLTNGRQTLIVHIQDINDKNPVFNSSEYDMNMSETLQTGSPVGSVHATDNDYSSEFNTVTYWIHGGDTNNSFYIDSRTGIIYLEKAVDFDPPRNQTNFSLEIYASDLHRSINGSIFNASTKVNIKVIDENDNIPIFEKVPINCVLPENKNGTFNCTVRATDADILDLNKINYRTWDPYQIFSINGSTGEVKALKSLDYESNYPEYTINVSAYDTAMNHGSRELKIYLQDENDETPHFSGSYNFSIPENERSNTFVGRVIATDRDKGSNLTYTLMSKSDFDINENGEIFTKKDFDCENLSSIKMSLTVQVNDSHNIQTTNVTVHILDQNDNSPIFVQNLYEATINESVAIGFHVVKVTANDADISKENNGLVKYTLLQSDEHHVPFSIDGTTGDVNVAGNLANTYQPLYVFYVMAEDQALVPSERRSKSCEVRINVARMNLHPPVINYQSDWIPVEISEAANVNSILLQVNATDEDFDILTYSLQPKQDYFKIDNRSGVITLQKALDRELMNTITLTIQVTDGKHLSNPHRIRVLITDVNDNGPVFNKTYYTFNLIEESGPELLGDIKATDADEGVNGNVTYQIINENSIGKFHINVLTGELTADRIDRESFGDKALLVIRASDQGTPQMTNVTMVEVHIQDINDNAPVFKNKYIHLKVREGEAVGTFLYQLEATDADEGDNATVKYIKINGSSFFRINETGAIFIANSPSVNKTNNEMLELFVEANNTAPFASPSIQNSWQFIQINVTDVNDKPPCFKETPYSFEINETLPTGSIVGRVQATDPDPSPEYSMIMYWIGNGNTDGAFFIERDTGNIYLIKPLDVDQIGSTTKYSLQVYASDIVPLEGNQSGNQSTTVTITVNDVNDNPPVFSSDVYWCDVKEEYRGIINCTVKATDLDKMDNNNITYKVVTKQEYFDIGKTNGQLSLTQTVDYETLPNPKEFHLIVTAKDTGSHRSNATVIVRIIDVDDTAPEFLNAPYNFYIDENSKKDTKVGSVFAVKSKNISYHLNSSDFRIDQNGNLFVQREFDFEEQHANPVVINVTAVDELNHTNSTLILVHILNINDNSPVFKSVPYNKTIDETLSDSSVFIVNVSATDLDQDSISYSIIDGNTENKFRIDNSAGVIHCQPTANSAHCQFNASIINRYDLIVQALDEGKPPRMNITSVTIFIMDVNNNPPRFSSDTYWGQVTENQESVKILTVAATDIDANSNLTFSVVGNYESTLFFFIGSDLFAHALDAENLTSIIVHINVTDSKYQDSAEVNVTVLDVNDNDPIIIASNNLSKAEDTKPYSLESIVTVVSATDKDVTNNGFTYVLLQSFGHFEIDPQNGTLTLISDFNFKERSSYCLTVRVYDHGIPPKSSETKITINVIETNKHCPHFKNMSYSFSVDENSTDASFQVLAEDLDKGPAGNFSFSIVSGNEGNLFHITEYSGLITFIHSPSYSETPYLLEVNATDHATHPCSGTVNVSIIVSDVNQPPVWDSDHSDHIYVNNGTKTGETILTVHAVDYDHVSIYKSITYSLDDISNFNIDNNNGTVKTNIDLNELKIYDLRVFAKDGGNRTINKTVHIEVLNIRITEGNVSFKEEQDPFCFYNVTTDAASAQGCVKFRLEDQHDGFNISEAGKMCTTTKLDREYKDQYNLKVLAEDCSGRRKIAQLKLKVSLEDINDNIPCFVSENPLKVQENSNISSLVSNNIVAKDKDSSAVLTYYIVRQRQPGLFSIDHNNGSVIVNGTLDREKMGDTYIIEVIVYDDSNHTHNVSGNFTINILDVNDESPTFNQSMRFNISESQSIKTVVGKVQAYDKDSNDEITYQITDGNKYGNFEIKPSGDIYLVTPLDYENTTTFNLTVVAYDKVNNTGKCTVRIDVLDVNDNKPEFSQSVYSAIFDEGNTSIHGQVNVSATDKDSGNGGEVTFLIESGNSTGNFKIQTINNTGIITIIKALDREDGTLLHFENNGSALYQLVVIGKDSGSPALSSTAHVNIYVNDINDCQPEFVQAPYSASLSEETEIGKSIQHVTATDRDFNPNITYSLENASGYFGIDSKGEIKLLKPVSIDDTFDNIQIIASDGVHNKSARLAINITDSNDHDPNFTQPIYFFSVPENDDGNRAIGNVSIGYVNATDADKGENGHVSYHILSQTPTNAFAILQNGTIVRTGTIDRENVTSFILMIGARDNGTKSRQSTCEVRVTVLDINDHNPVFSRQTYVGSVKESANTNVSVTMTFPIHAEDIDFGENGTAGIKYSLKGTASDSFEIDGKTGVIYTKKVLDRETQSQYNFTVIAGDRNGTGRNSIANVTIDILDENDCSPYFVMEPYKIDIYENASTSSSIGNVTAYDLDVNGNDSIKYHIESGAEDKFIIDSHTGYLWVSGKLDREEKSEYTLNVSASDGLHFNYTTVYINIDDINDNCPEFYTKKVEYDVTENTDLQVVGNFSAFDLDSGQNGNVTVFMNDSTLNHSFSVDRDGNLRTLKKFDREENSHYHLKIYATDHGNPPCISFINVDIKILDKNDNPPVFYDEDGTPNITDARSYIVDQSPVGSIILVPSVQDRDEANTNNSHVTYSFKTGHDEQYFIINPTTGAVRIKSRIDINTLLHLHNISASNMAGNQMLKVLIVAQDGGVPSLNSTLLLTVFIEPLNEASPSFEKDVYNFSIRENVDAGSFIGQVSAHIVNESISHLTYQNLLSLDSQYIHVHSHTGNITTTNKIFDREIENHYTFEIQVTDGRTPERTAFATVELVIEDDNDNKPVFPQKYYEFEIPENVNSTNEVMNISATDADEGNNSKIHYELVGETDENFSLNESTGILELIGTLDRESRAEYKFTITASDGGSPPLNSTTSVVIKVLDVNDNSPIFYGQPYIFNISENDQKSFQVHANDSDFGENGSVVYEITRDGMVPFYISPLDGKLSLITPLGYETQKQYHFEIVASDLGKVPKKTRTNVTVISHVIGGKVMTNYTVPVPENYNGPFPQIIYDLNSTEEQQGNVFYELIESDPKPEGELFKLDNTNGTLYCERSLDREEHSQYILTIRISNTSQSGHIRNKRDTAEQARIIKLLIIIRDENDNPPTVQRDSLTFHIFKNTKANYIVGKVIAEDKDGDTDLRFNITGNEVETFRIHPIIGEIITLKDISSINKMNFVLHLYVTDQGGLGLSSDANITILVIPESDRLILVADMNKFEFNKSQDVLVRNMSEILGVSLFIESIEYHKEVNGDVELLDLEKSDAFIHATNTTTGEILSRNDLQRLLDEYGEALRDFFKQMKIKSVHTVPWNVHHTASTIGAAEIAIICLAVVIGIGGIAAVCFVRCSDTDDDGKPNFQKNLEELWELESQHGSTRRFPPAEVVNPCFSETKFDESDGDDETTRAKRLMEYETQELHMELPSEIPGNDDDERTDSGLDNDSSGSERQQSESHSIVSKEESDEDQPFDAMQMDTPFVREPSSGNSIQNNDRPESMDHSWNSDEGNLNEGNLKKLNFYGSQILLDATVGDTEDADPTLETETKTEEEMKENETDLSLTTSKSINDTESKLILADDTKLENASSNDIQQIWMQESINDHISEEDNVTSL